MGIFRTHERNLAFLAKLVWRFHTERHLTWAKICAINYNLPSFKKSITGKCLFWGKIIFDWGTRIVIYLGNNTNFWHDPWLFSSNARSLIHGPLLLEDQHATISNFPSAGGFWDRNSFPFVWPNSIKHVLDSIPRGFGNSRENTFS